VIPPDDVAVAVRPEFDELGRLSFADHTLRSLLHRVTGLAAGVLPGEPVISVTILAGDRPATVATTGDLAVRLDHVQYRLGSGPCLSAAGTGRPSELVDTRSATPLTRVSMETNTKVRDIAERFVATGDLPGNRPDLSAGRVEGHPEGHSGPTALGAAGSPENRGSAVEQTGR